MMKIIGMERTLSSNLSSNFELFEHKNSSIFYRGTKFEHKKVRFFKVCSIPRK